ncbi:hypothetical protein OH76DRAFT_1486090 [Lentinus brumalis]|uniref:Uncharacterized protein n=1 Tax=Lentinus brumalis TaxID=2498619 RepID=A0A371CZT0_9APHY|nr:hypothetical protein OH76DRAFT_1486090 [Polyporus brumalis]
MDVDQTPGETQRRESRTSLSMEPLSLLESTGRGNRRHAAFSSHETRRRLRDALSDPREEEDDANHHGRPNVEDASEEGELFSPRLPRESSNTRSDNPEGFYRQNGFTLPPLHETPWSAREASTSRASQDSRWNASSLSGRSNLSRGYEEEHEERGASRGAREGMPTQFSSARQQQNPHGPPHTSTRHDQRRSDAHPRPTTLPDTNRINGLDVFDVGGDDNLPDAVRRGGATQDGDMELPTPIPFEGDPEVHRHDPEAHLRGMSDVWVQEVWADPMNTSITLNTFNPHYSRSYGTNRRTASDLRRFVSQITGESNFLVIAPDQAPDHRGRGPVEWAITGLTGEGVERLLRRRVWSFKSITFFPRRRALENPRWILALEGFLEDNVSNIEAAVRSTFERPQVRQRILQMILANPEFNSIPTDEAFRRIMATLRVSVYTLDNETVVANVFLRSPTQSIRVWRRWILELRDLTFGSYHTAIARVRRISSCAGCLGVDHPSHLCPFTRLPNWNGPESAGGNSYSVDGRERRGRQQPEASQNLQEPYNHTWRQRNQSQDADSARAGPSRSQAANAVGDWDGRGRELGWDGRRGNGPGSSHEHGRRGLPRKGKKDAPGQPKYGRDNYRKDGRR